jgi:hypothetical protein
MLRLGEYVRASGRRNDVSDVAGSGCRAEGTGMTILFSKVFCFVLLAFAGGIVVGVVLEKFSIRRLILTLTDNLKAATDALNAKVDAARASATAEIARVEATIAALKLAQQGGSVSDADVQAAIDSMTTTATNLGTLGQQLDAEDVIPTPGS